MYFLALHVIPGMLFPETVQNTTGEETEEEMWQVSGVSMLWELFLWQFLYLSYIAPLYHSSQLEMCPEEFFFFFALTYQC